MGLSGDYVNGEQLYLTGPVNTLTPPNPFVVMNEPGAGPPMQIFVSNGNPNGVIVANAGSIACDTYGNLWLKAVGDGNNTGWSQVSVAAPAPAPSVNTPVVLSAARPVALTAQGSPSSVTTVPSTTPNYTTLPSTTGPLAVAGQYIVLTNSASPSLPGVGYYFRAPLTGSGPGFWFQDTTQPPTIRDTHANRASYPAANYAVGTVYYETDTNVSYCVQIPSPSNANTWLYYNGIAESVLASIPGYLGVNDIGYLFRASDYLHNWLWTGTAWSLIAAALAGEQGGSFPGTTVVSVGGPPFGGSGALWHLCDGSTVNVSQENATVVATALPTIANTYFAR